MTGTEVAVADAADVSQTERAVRAAATDLDLPETAVEEVAIVARELAENILSHADHGSVTVRRRDRDGRTGIEVRARDIGPGIEDLERALEDGHSTAGSLGYGLGAVHRLMDDVAIGPTDGAAPGLEVVATRWAATTSVATEPPVDVGAATRPCPGEGMNGDAFVIHHEGGDVLVGVIDGLGHGPLAHEASSAARRHVIEHAGQPIDRLFAGVERACRSTRGVVMALARFDADGRVSVGSVGNISIRVFDAAHRAKIVTPRGVLGANGPKPVVSDWAWEPAATLVMHSDGVEPDWDGAADDLSTGSATQAARRLLRGFAVSRDDATVLLARGVAR